MIIEKAKAMRSAASDLMGAMFSRPTDAANTFNTEKDALSASIEDFNAVLDQALADVTAVLTP